MSKLPVVSGLEVIKALVSFGWVADRQRGDHVILERSGRRSIPVPLYPEISKKLLRKIIKESGIDRKEFIRYLIEK